MRRRTDNVEIQAPPLLELKKKRSCLKQSCASGCGCFVVFVLLFFLLTQTLVTPRPKRLDKIPDVLPGNITLYDKDTIDRGTYLSARQKHRVLERIAQVPKLLLSPILLTFDRYTSFETDAPRLTRENIVRLLKEPVGEESDTLTIYWSELTAEPGFILDFYTKELNKQGFRTRVVQSTNTVKELSFSTQDITGLLTIIDDPATAGTSLMTLVIDVVSTE